MTDKKHIDKTSGDKKSIGFDFQYYFFLWKLLSLTKGQSVGLEVKDDVHSELDDDVNIYYQIKHSVQHNPNGQIINLTSHDKDLWKTLYNWSKVIVDENDNRKDLKSQVEFIRKSHFIMWSNKNLSPNNLVIKGIDDLQNLKISFDDFIKIIMGLEQQSRDKSIKEYINEFLKLDKSVLNDYVNKISFELGEDEIIKKCKEAIEVKMIEKSKVDDVFAKVDSKLKEDNFVSIKSGAKIQISFEDFYTKYRKYFNNTRNGLLQVSPYTNPLPKKLEEQIFIQQLLEINDILVGDIEKIAQFTRYKLKLENNLTKWYTEGEITWEEIDSYRNDAILQWQNKFNRHVKKATFNDEKSQEIIDDLREQKLIIEGQSLDTELSNGEFYYLSNIPIIGWKKDWEKYKK